MGENIQLLLPSFPLLLPPTTFVSPALTDCIPHSTTAMKKKKGHFPPLEGFGLSLWNTNVDAVIHGNRTSDKTKGNGNVSRKFASVM